MRCGHGINQAVPQALGCPSFPGTMTSPRVVAMGLICQLSLFLNRIRGRCPFEFKLNTLLPARWYLLHANCGSLTADLSPEFVECVWGVSS